MTKTTATTKHHWTIAPRLRALAFCLSRSRFSIIVLLASLALLLSDQGQDVLLAYGENPGSLPPLSLYLVTPIWAVSIWGWCRLLLDINYPDLPRDQAAHFAIRKWLPRLLGAGAFATMALAAALVEQWALCIWSIILGLIFLVVVIMRRAASRRIASHVAKLQHNVTQRMALALDIPEMDKRAALPYANFWEAVGLRPSGRGVTVGRFPLRTYGIVVMVAGFLVLATWGNADPVSLGKMFGAVILLLLWAPTWLPIGSYLSWVADFRGIPLLTLLLVVALVFSFWNDNHDIRPAPAGLAVSQRHTVDQALDAWAQANPAQPGVRTPLVVVATAGGGIRAAYWTATVLGQAEDHAADFSKRTFAMSGVSGGSVGATVFRALLDVPAQQFNISCPHGYADCAQRITGQDGLGAVAAALLYPDLVQRFWFQPIFRDRGAALEESWERSFKQVVPDSRGLNASLASLRIQPWAPALFLNSTWVDNGRRIVASNLKFSNDESSPFVLSNDELSVLGYDLRLSTAAHNSARFPFVSPAGTWRKEGRIAGRLQDGGLFENYGAETAREILQAVCRKFDCTDEASGATGKRKVMPVVVMITSDPKLPKRLDKSYALPPLHFAYELRSTLRSYARVRTGRGAELAAQLKQWVATHDGKFFYFRMCPDNGDTEEPPLGWSLSESARRAIQSYLPLNGGARSACETDNAGALHGLTESLASRPASTSGTSGGVTPGAN